ncbi:MAG: helix-turn-helix domain-containing protein [Coriobacteriia bacterium]|nr:helix-turn-helix domain-containing protein [Coriobacteriia bacterium]
MVRPLPELRFFTDVMPGRKGEILDAAVAIFADKGYDAGSMREIAERVGVTEPALYRHFTSKEDLFLALIAGVGTRVQTEVGPLLDSATPGNIAETLEAVFTNRTRAARTYLPVIRTVIVASLHNQAFRTAYRQNVSDPIFARLERLVPAVDAYYGIDASAEETAERVRALISVFVGQFITAFVFDDEPMPLTETFMRVMGWATR